MPSYDTFSNCRDLPYSFSQRRTASPRSLDDPPPAQHEAFTFRVIPPSPRSLSGTTLCDEDRSCFDDEDFLMTEHDPLHLDRTWTIKAYRPYGAVDRYENNDTCIQPSDEDEDEDEDEEQEPCTPYAEAICTPCNLGRRFVEYVTSPAPGAGVRAISENPTTENRASNSDDDNDEKGACSSLFGMLKSCFRTLACCDTGGQSENTHNSMLRHTVLVPPRPHHVEVRRERMVVAGGESDSGAEEGSCRHNLSVEVPPLSAS